MSLDKYRVKEGQCDSGGGVSIGGGGIHNEEERPSQRHTERAERHREQVINGIQASLRGR